jgi:hypothetical protein
LKRLHISVVRNFSPSKVTPLGKLNHCNLSLHCKGAISHTLLGFFRYSVTVLNAPGSGGLWGAFIASGYNGHRWAYSNNSNCTINPPFGNDCTLGAEGNPAFGTIVPYCAITIHPSCSAPSAIVNSPSGPGSVTMVCSAFGGLGGGYSYQWYAGNTCSGEDMYMTYQEDCHRCWWKWIVWEQLRLTTSME